MQKIAENVILIDLNVNFLLRNHYDVKFTMMQKYLESGTWVKKIRMSAV